MKRREYQNPPVPPGDDPDKIPDPPAPSPDEPNPPVPPGDDAD